MEEIDLSSLLNYFKKQSIYIVFITIIASLTVGSYTLYLKTPLYNSNVTLVLTTDSSSENSGITSSDIQINEQLIQSYSYIIKSKSVLNKVIENLKIEGTYEALYDSITITNITNTEILKIEVSNEDPYASKVIANEVSRVFCEEIVEYYSIENVSVIDEAEESTYPYNMAIFSSLALGALLGFSLMSLLVFAMFYFDKTLKTKEEVEKLTGLPVIGIVPLSEDK